MEVFALEGSEPRPLTHQNQELLANLKLGSVEEIKFNSKDGTTIMALSSSRPIINPESDIRQYCVYTAGPLHNSLWLFL